MKNIFKFLYVMKNIISFFIKSDYKVLDKKIT